MKIFHIGNLKSGIDTYVRNTVALANDDFEFVIVSGADDNSEPYIRHGKPVTQYTIDMYRKLESMEGCKGCDTGDEDYPQGESQTWCIAIVRRVG